MSEYQYILDEDRRYVLHDGDEAIAEPLDEVAICLDADDGTLHKHGSPEKVLAFHRVHQTTFRAAGLDSLADDLVVIQGRFDPDEINKCLSITGYGKKLYEAIHSGKAESVPRRGTRLQP